LVKINQSVAKHLCGAGITGNITDCLAEVHQHDHVPVFKRQNVVMIASRSKRKSSLLHFLRKYAGVHFANRIAGEIDFAKYGSRSYGTGDAEDHVPIRQQFHGVWSVALSSANVVVPDRVTIPVSIKTLNCLGSGGEYIHQLNSVVLSSG